MRVSAMAAANQRRAKRAVYSVGQIGGRWTLVAPDGRPFVSIGVSHLAAISEDSAVFKTLSGGDRAQFVPQLAAFLGACGFNTAGYRHPENLRAILPFVADSFLASVAYFAPRPRFPDVFHPSFPAAARRLIRQMCSAAKSNPNLIGYYWTDTPRWDLDTARRLVNDDWVSAIRRLPAPYRGKQRYVEFLCERHHRDPAGFSAAYGLVLDESSLLDASFDGLVLDNPVVHRDDYAFLRLIAREYYRVAGETMEHEDRRHLVFGDRYLLSDLPIEVLEEASPWIDVVAVQPFRARFESEQFDRVYRIARKPIIICGHAIPVSTDAPRAYADYMSAAFARPYMVGYHRSYFADRIAKGASVQGLMREDGTPQQAFIEAVRGANARALARVQSQPE